MLLYISFLLILFGCQAYTPNSKFNSHFLPFDHNTKIHYVQAGEITNPTILLIPGFGVGTFHYDQNIEELSKEFNVYS